MWLDSSVRIPELGTIVFTQLLIFDSNVPQFGRTICAFTMWLFIFIFLTTAISEEWGLGRLWYTALWRHHRSWRCAGGEWGWVEVCWRRVRVSGDVLEVYWRPVFLVFVLKLTTEGADGDSDALWLCGCVWALSVCKGRSFGPQVVLMEVFVFLPEGVQISLVGVFVPWLSALPPGAEQKREVE